MSVRLSKKHIDDTLRVIDDYIRAYSLVHGVQAADKLEIFVRRGWFYLKLNKHDPKSKAIPWRRPDIVAMTLNLHKRIPPRLDSHQNGEPD